MVGRWRQKYESETARGLPAHITLLYPFKPAEDFQASLLRELREFFAAQSLIQFRLRRVATFPGVLYLAPEPAVRFIDLTGRLAARYPENPPYGGIYETIVPHLSVAKSADTRVQEEVSVALLPQLPIDASAREVWLMVEHEDGWHLHSAFPLASKLKKLPA